MVGRMRKNLFLTKIILLPGSRRGRSYCEEWRYCEQGVSWLLEYFESEEQSAR